MRLVRALVLVGVLPLLACQPGTHHKTKERPVPDMPEIQARLAFTYAYEKDKIPPRDPEAVRSLANFVRIPYLKHLHQPPNIHPRP